MRQDDYQYTVGLLKINSFEAEHSTPDVIHLVQPSVYNIVEAHFRSRQLARLTIHVRIGDYGCYTPLRLPPIDLPSIGNYAIGIVRQSVGLGSLALRCLSSGKEVHVPIPAFYRTNLGPMLNTTGEEGAISKNGVCFVQATFANEKVRRGVGFVIHPEGYVLTCSHVVVGARQIQVQLAGHWFLADVLAWESREVDTALLKLPPGRYQWLPVVEPDVEPQEREQVHMYHFPVGHGQRDPAYAEGVISAPQDPMSPCMFQLSTQLTHGDSGAPVIRKSDRRVIGMIQGSAPQAVPRIDLAVAVREIRARFTSLV